MSVENLQDQIVAISHPSGSKAWNWRYTMLATMGHKTIPLYDNYGDLVWHDAADFNALEESAEVFAIFVGNMRTINSSYYTGENSPRTTDLTAFNKAVAEYIAGFNTPSDLLYFRMIVIVKTENGDCWRVVVFRDNLFKPLDSSLLHLLQNCKRYDLIPADSHEFFHKRIDPFTLAKEIE